MESKRRETFVLYGIVAILLAVAVAAPWWAVRVLALVVAVPLAFVLGAAAAFFSLDRAEGQQQ